MKLASEKDYTGALKVILDKNPLPFITGTVCAHNCMTMCTRNFYESPVHIRNVKLECAQKAYQQVLEALTPVGKINKKAAIVGGGPAGIAAAFYLARAGVNVTIFEKRKTLGGIVTWTVPDFRIDYHVVEKDVAFIEKLGVKIQTDTEIRSIDDLKKQGFDAVIIAVGGLQNRLFKIEGCEPLNALTFMEEFNQTQEKFL